MARFRTCYYCFRIIGSNERAYIAAAQPHSIRTGEALSCFRCAVEHGDAEAIQLRDDRRARNARRAR